MARCTLKTEFYVKLFHCNTGATSLGNSADKLRMPRMCCLFSTGYMFQRVSRKTFLSDEKVIS